MSEMVVVCVACGGYWGEGRGVVNVTFRPSMRWACAAVAAAGGWPGAAPPPPSIPPIALTEPPPPPLPTTPQSRSGNALETDGALAVAGGVARLPALRGLGLM